MSNYRNPNHCDVCRAIVKALRRQRARMLWVRRSFGIGCTCPVVALNGAPHHFACGTNR